MKKWLNATIVLLILASVVAGCATPAQPQPTQPPTAAPPTPPQAPAQPTQPPTEGGKKVLRVGLNSENVPWEFMREGELVGFEVDMLKELAKRMDVELEFITVPFSGIFTGLQAGKWDLASSSIWITEERLKEMDFADPYYDSDIKSFAERWCSSSPAAT